MRDKQAFKGKWHLPQLSKNAVGGILSFDPNEGGSLELFDRFDSWDPFNFPDGADIILGLTVDGKEITLVECICTSFRTVGSEAHIIFVVRFILIGAHADTIEHLMFNKIIADIHNLAEWVGITGLNIKEEVAIDREVSINFKIPNKISFKIDSSTEGCLIFDRRNVSRHRKPFEISLTHTTQLEISCKEPKTLQEILKKVTAFQNFMILGLYHPTYSTQVSIEGNQFVKTYERFGDIPIRIEVLAASQYSVDSFQPKRHKHEVLFLFEDIREQFPNMIKLWYQKYESFDHIMYLLFQQFYSHKNFTEDSFLNLARAIESYHERTRVLHKMPEADYSRMKDDLLISSDSKYHEWLTSMFTIGNSATLHMRLEDLLSVFDNSSLNWLVWDKDQFIKNFKRSRNYYTHLGKSLEKKALRGADLYRMNLRLKLMLVVLFLMDVGIEIETISAWIGSRAHKFVWSWQHIS